MALCVMPRALAPPLCGMGRVPGVSLWLCLRFSLSSSLGRPHHTFLILSSCPSGVRREVPGRERAHVWASVASPRSLEVMEGPAWGCRGDGPCSAAWAQRGVGSVRRGLTWFPVRGFHHGPGHFCVFVPFAPAHPGEGCGLPLRAPQAPLEPALGRPQRAGLPAGHVC